MGPGPGPGRVEFQGPGRVEAIQAMGTEDKKGRDNNTGRASGRGTGQGRVWFQAWRAIC